VFLCSYTPFMKMMRYHPIALIFAFTGLILLNAAEDERPLADVSKIHSETPADPRLPTLFIVGDSTVQSRGQKGAYGWGERIAPYFDITKINVVNYAIGGRSSRTFFTEGRWDNVMTQLKTGDIVIIQFGHNDGGRIGDPAGKRRASGKGTGPETVNDPKPDGSDEFVHTFGWYMAKYVTDVRKKGAVVILCSPIPHKDKWEEDRDFSNVAQWDQEVAAANGALYIDLTKVVSDSYRKIGKEKVDTFFSDARTHTNDAGAQFNAACVIAGLKSLPQNPIAPYFSEKAAEIPAGQTAP
jgi:lysophospholipase L1-like esterase